MNKIQFDIDIDMAQTLDKTVYGTRAMKVDDKKIVVHPSGYYLPEDNIPVDPITNYASVDYKRAEELGYVKVDLLSNTAYNSFSSKEELTECIEREPNWELFLDDIYLSKMPHIANHGDVVKMSPPKSIEDLADVLALIRPAKRKYLDAYITNKYETRTNLYRKPKEGYFFKKSHAVAYAIMIVAVLNKLDNGMVTW